MHASWARGTRGQSAHLTRDRPKVRLVGCAWLHRGARRDVCLHFAQQWPLVVGYGPLDAATPCAIKLGSAPRIAEVVVQGNRTFLQHLLRYMFLDDDPLQAFFASYFVLACAVLILAALPRQRNQVLRMLCSGSAMGACGHCLGSCRSDCK